MSVQMPIISGSTNNQVKAMELQKKLQEKNAENITSPENPQQAKGPEKTENTEEEQKIEMLRKHSQGIQDSNVMAGIDTKLRSGKKLSRAELNYLRTKSPEMYKKAMAIEQRRNQYKNMLKHCHTKEDAKMLKSKASQGFFIRADAMMGNSSTISGVNGLDSLALEKAAMQDEYTSFMKSHPFLKETKKNKIITELSLDKRNVSLYDRYSKKNKTVKKNSMSYKV